MMADQAALVNPGVGAATAENELSEKQRETSETNDGNLGDTVVKMKVDEKEKVKEGEKKKEQPAEFKAYLVGINGAAGKQFTDETSDYGPLALDPTYFFKLADFSPHLQLERWVLYR